MTFDLARFERIHNRHKLTVFGYIKEESKSSSLPYIPTVINYICLAYYEPNSDFFDKRDYTKVTLSIDQFSATLTRCDYSPVAFFTIPSITYGYYWIESLSKSKHEWEFKMKRKYGTIEIGISTKDDIFTEEIGTQNEKSISYGLQIHSNYFELNENYYGRCHGRIFKQNKNNLSHIVLTLENGRLSFSINTENQAFYKICDLEIQTGKDVKYKMAVALRTKNDSISLQKYTIAP